jgi:hypothetical protein
MRASMILCQSGCSPLAEWLRVSARVATVFYYSVLSPEPEWLWFSTRLKSSVRVSTVHCHSDYEQESLPSSTRIVWFSTKV